MNSQFDPTIFREYDIRGIVGENLTATLVEKIGLGFAHILHESRSTPTVLIGGDARPSSEPFRKALAQGLVRGGVDVIDIGEVATPVLYFAIHHWNIPNGIVITGSHNPSNYNGLKLTKDFQSFAGENIRELGDMIRQDNLPRRKEGKKSSCFTATEEYIEAVKNDITLTNPVKVVVDCGNGITGAYAPGLYQALGCEVIPLFDEVDGSFPNHHPDPTLPENLEDLIQAVKKHGADIGIAFDGDGDRVGLVTDQGEIIWLDRLMAFFSTEILREKPNSSVIYDIKCSRSLTDAIRAAGGKPIMWKTGHTHIKAKIKSESAVLGGEFAGHICFCDRWFGFDDGPYAGARMLEVLSSTSRSMQDIFDQFPQLPTTPELFVPISDESKFQFIEQLQANGTFKGGQVSTLDGVRADYADGFGLVRASNTSPKLTLRFEGESRESIYRIYETFVQEMHQIDPTLPTPDLIYA